MRKTILMLFLLVFSVITPLSLVSKSVSQGQIEQVGTAYRFQTLSGDYVYIGDPSDSEFHPKVTLNRWRGECWLGFRFVDTGFIADTVLENNVVKWQTQLFELHFYSVEPQQNLNELGGLEFEVLFKQKPPMLGWAFPLNTYGLSFYFQPPLDKELNVADYDFVNATHAIKDGETIFYRPENIVGSYAVYHTEKLNNEYETGKAFHIYRPKLIDSLNVEAWANLTISDNNLMLTLPQDFMDKAAYPVRLDPNFGYETIGGTDAILASGTGMRIRGSVFSCPQSGTANNITVALKRQNPGSDYVKCGLYEHSASPLSLVDATTQIDTSLGNSYDWYNYSFASPPSISAIDYVPVVWAEYVSKTIYLAYDSGDTNQGHWTSELYNGFPNPLSVSHDNNKYSIYCAYAAEGGGQTYYEFPQISLTFSLSSVLTFYATYSIFSAINTVLSLASSVQQIVPTLKVFSAINTVFGLSTIATAFKTYFQYHSINSVFTLATSTTSYLTYIVSQGVNVLFSLSSISQTLGAYLVKPSIDLVFGLSSIVNVAHIFIQNSAINVILGMATTLNHIQGVFVVTSTVTLRFLLESSTAFIQHLFTVRPSISIVFDFLETVTGGTIVISVLTSDEIIVVAFALIMPWIFMLFGLYARKNLEEE